MKKQIIKKAILSTSITLMGLGAVSSFNSDTSLSSNIHAAQFQGQNQANELKNYYSQTPEIFSNKKLTQVAEGSDKGKIYVDIQRSWGAFINVAGGESWGNINNLRNKQVDVFGIKDKPTSKYWWAYTEYFTGGVTPAANPSAPVYPINVTVKKNAIVKNSFDIKAFETRKDKITLKELDFQIRKALINNNNLYSNGQNKGTVQITTKDNKVFTFDLSKKLENERANIYVDGKNIATIVADIKIG